MSKAVERLYRSPARPGLRLGGRAGARWGLRGFTLVEVLIVVAIIAILAMTAVAMYQRYLERARGSAAQNILWQLALAQAAGLVEAEADGAGADYVFVAAGSDIPAVKKLMEFGFRSDPAVGWAVLPMKSGAPGFVAFAAHRAAGSWTHVYDSVSFTGVRPFNSGASWGADLPEKLPLFVSTGDLADPVASTETVKLDVATGRVISSGP